MSRFWIGIVSLFMNIITIMPVIRSHRRRIGIEAFVYSGEGIRSLINSFCRVIVSRLINTIPIIGTRRRKKAIESLFHSEGIQFLIKSLCSNIDEETSLTTSLLTGNFKNSTEVVQKLTELQKERIKGTLDANKKTVAICFTTRGYRGNIGNITDKLRSRGLYNVLTLLGEVCGDNYEQQENVFYMPNEGLSSVDFIDVFICVRPLDNPPVNGKLVYFLHDIHDSAIGDVEDNFRIVLGFDYFFLSSCFLVERVQKQISVGKQKFLVGTAKEKEICVIGGGYPRLDRNLEYFEEYKQDAKILIYAPTITTMEGLEDLVSVPQYGDEIIEAILNNFTDYDLIFRPHPSSLYTAEVENIAKKYRNHPRFTLDDNASFYRDNYSKSALMITDMSGTAYTYAFTTLRPVIFFSPDEAEVMRRFGTYQYFIDREKIGYVAQNVDEMVDKIGLLLTSRDEFSLRIKQYRDSLIYNIGKSEDYFVDNFEYIIEDKKHPDWVYL